MKDQQKSAALFGFGQADITPDWPVQMIGFDREDQTSRGVLHPLLAQALVFEEAGGARCCLVAVDSIGFTLPLTQTLRTQLASAVQCRPDEVMVCFSHTHAAPDAAADKRYFLFACSRIVEAARRALECIEPLAAGWSEAPCALGVNRRGDAQAVCRTMGVLLLRRLGEKRPGVLVLQATAHANVLSSDNYLLSSDYFGAVREAVEAAYGCSVMVVQGAAGDIRPRFQQENAVALEIQGRNALRDETPEERRRHIQQCRRALQAMAQEALRGVAAVIDTMESKPVYLLRLETQNFRCSAGVPSLSRAREIADEALREAGIPGEDWLAEVERLNEAGVTEQHPPAEIAYLFLNDGCLCGVPFECMCSLALAVRRKTLGGKVFFGGYVNGIDAYLPDAREYDRGGYEVLWSNLLYFSSFGHVMPLNRDTAALLVRRISGTCTAVFSETKEDTGR